MADFSAVFKPSDHSRKHLQTGGGWGRWAICRWYARRYSAGTMLTPAGSSFVFKIKFRNMLWLKWYVGVDDCFVGNWFFWSKIKHGTYLFYEEVFYVLGTGEDL